VDPVSVVTGAKARSETRSQALYEEACRHIPGGVNSPVRAMRAVGRTHPLFIARAQGAWVEDADGNRYVDLVGSWGPMILGHADPGVLTILKETAARGTSFGAPTVLEIELASAVKDAMPSIELVRFVSSGTEAAMSAVRLARAATGRNKILKFAGCYHGHADALLVEAGSGLATLGIPASPGVPPTTTADTLTAPFNDLASVRTVIERHGDELACIIVEPVPGNMGCVPPADGFLEGLREACDDCGALLVFDEVMTGFRVAYGGAQERYRITPDLTVLGKIVGGGMPAAAFGGRGDLMERLAPIGAVYQAGTLSGNPLAMAAGLATLTRLARLDTYEQLERVSADLEAGLRRAAHGHAISLNRVGSMLTLFFTAGPVTDYETARRSDLERFGAFFRAALDGRVYLAPSQFEAGFVSLAHGPREVEQVVAAAEAFFQPA
jgi:glutamate-1-semialdehyde 2,1-aminomutase